MNIVFFGSSNFAVSSLNSLLTSGHKVSCVVTQPDRQKGRGLHLEGTIIKTIALESNLKVYQPYNINAPEAIRLLEGLNPDLFVVIAYGQILSPEILGIPKIFSVNIHASLLPKYRGAAPINWAIIKGEKTTGITVIRMTQGMDAGPIILQKAVDISASDTAITLGERLSQLAAQSLADALSAIEQNDYKLIPQDEKKAAPAPKLTKDDGQIDWNKPAQDIHNLIRGCIAWPGAFTYYNSKLLKIYDAEIIRLSDCQSVNIPGEIIKVSKEGIAVATRRDELLIKELQIEGKRRMKAEEFIRGHKIYSGEILGKNK